MRVIRPSFWLCVGLALVSGSCASYTEAPLDLEAFREDFLQRQAELPHAIESEEPFDPSDGLDHAEAEVLALFWNRELRRVRAEFGVQWARAEHAGQWADPVFGFDAAEILSPSGPFEWGTTVGLSIPLFGRLAAEREAEAAEMRAAAERVRRAEWMVRMDTRAAFARWRRAAAAVVAFDRLDQDLRAAESFAERLAAAGEIPRGEARLFAIERAARTLERRRMESELAAERAAIFELVGLPPETKVELRQELRTPRRPDQRAHEIALVATHPDLTVARAEYAAAEAALRHAVRATWPDLELSSGYGEEGDQRLLLGAGIRLPLWNAGRQAIAEHEARRTAARVAAEIALERALSRSAELLAARARLQATLATGEAELLPLLAAQAEEASRLSALGAIQPVVLLETITRGHAARTELAALRAELLAQDIEIERLVGPAPSATALAAEPHPETTP